MHILVNIALILLGLAVLGVVLYGRFSQKRPPREILFEFLSHNPDDLLRLQEAIERHRDTLEGPQGRLAPPPGDYITRHSWDRRERDRLH
jgi:hypothetical protein